MDSLEAVVGGMLGWVGLGRGGLRGCECAVGVWVGKRCRGGEGVCKSCRYCFLEHTSENHTGYCLWTIPSDMGSEPISTHSRFLRRSLVCVRRQSTDRSDMNSVRPLASRGLPKIWTEEAVQARGSSTSLLLTNSSPSQLGFLAITQRKLILSVMATTTTEV